MNILLIGYGSIGARHGAILADLGCQVAVVSGNHDCPYERFSDISAALDARSYQGAIIATPTKRHFNNFQDLAAAGFAGRILVEKPLWSEVGADDGLKAELAGHVHTAYNLRFHPLLQRSKELLADRPIYSINAYAGQYLPQWRPSRDYRSTYSALKEEGGGALRDLSHELDYLQWLAGTWQSVVACGGLVSRLEINSDDLCGLMMRTAGCPMVQAQLNYLDMVPGGRREFAVNAEGLSLQVNLNQGWLSINGKEPEIIKPDRNYTYTEQLKAWLAGPENSELCDYDGGMRVVRLIDAAEKSMIERCWVDR